MEKITSKSNNLVKDTKKLITSSKSRQENGAFVLEGARLCFDVLNSVYKTDTVLITEKAYQRYKDKADELIRLSKSAYLISDDVADKLSDTDSAQGIFAICKTNENKADIYGDKIIALDNVQDPSNVGAVIRTAEALGIDTVIAYNCCDIYNPKVLRASMGSVLRMNIHLSDDLEKTLAGIRDTYRIYSTVPSSRAERITNIDFSCPCVCVIGNEANGVEENIKSISDKLITIPMLGKAESLNAGAAAAITMWEMLR